MPHKVIAPQSCCPTEFVDCRSSSGINKPGEWRSVVVTDIGCSRELPKVRESRSRQDLLEVRSGIKTILKLNKGRLIGNILMLDAHEKCRFST